MTCPTKLVHHDYADPDPSQDEKESVRQAKGRTKRTPDRIKLSRTAQYETGVFETKILKTYPSDGLPGLCTYCRSNGNDTRVLTAFICRMCGNYQRINCREVGQLVGCDSGLRFLQCSNELMDPSLNVKDLMRTELNEKEVQEEVFKRNFLYGSGVANAKERRKQRMSQIVSDVQNGISSRSTVLDFLITRGLDRIQAQDETFRPRDGINGYH